MLNDFQFGLVAAESYRLATSFLDLYQPAAFPGFDTRVVLAQALGFHSRHRA